MALQVGVYPRRARIYTEEKSDFRLLFICPCKERRERERERFFARAKVICSPSRESIKYTSVIEIHMKLKGAK